MWEKKENHSFHKNIKQHKNCFLSTKLEWFLKDDYVALKTGGVMAASITGINYILKYIKKRLLSKTLKYLTFEQLCKSDTNLIDSVSTFSKGFFIQRQNNVHLFVNQATRHVNVFFVCFFKQHNSQKCCSSIYFVMHVFLSHVQYKMQPHNSQNIIYCVVAQYILPHWWRVIQEMLCLVMGSILFPWSFSGPSVTEDECGHLTSVVHMTAPDIHTNSCSLHMTEQYYCEHLPMK